MPSEAQLVNFKIAVPLAQAAMRQFEVPASVTLAQWEFESTWGTSDLAIKAHNYFGITHSQKNLAEPYMEFPTDDYLSGKLVLHDVDFVRYVSEGDSFKAHARLLATAPRYAPAMAVRRDPLAFCRQLQVCGYSTDPRYAQKLIDAIAAGHLTQYDVLPPADPAAASMARAA